MNLTHNIIQGMPKVLLHDHLDGGVRPGTVIDLAAEAGFSLPTDDPEALAQWFHRGANRGSLPLYLEGFGTTCAVMQTAKGLERIAYEAIEDLAEDGVVYGEIRFAPCFHRAKGLSLEEVLSSVLAGFERGRRAHAVDFGLIVCAMRDREDSREMAELAVAFKDRGVVGFDIAGEESGHPPKHHLDAFHYIQRENFNITIHAGEGFGLDSIWQALQYCGAHRIGHATRLMDDIVVRDGEAVEMKDLAHYVRDKRFPLEMCLSSNVHTGAVESVESHPFGLLHRLNFRTTLNTDNRLMSATTMTDEYALAVRHFGLDLPALEKLSINAMKSAFLHYEDRLKIIYDVIKPGFLKIRGDRRSG